LQVRYRSPINFCPDLSIEEFIFLNKLKWIFSVILDMKFTYLYGIICKEVIQNTFKIFRNHNKRNNVPIEC
jgi:hypothetical protein